MFINESGIIGIVVVSLTDNVTGSLFLTLLLIVMLLMSICILFRMPIEWSSLIVMPLLIVIGSFQGSFISVLGVFLIYAGILLAKYWIVNNNN